MTHQFIPDRVQGGWAGPKARRKRPDRVPIRSHTGLVVNQTAPPASTLCYYLFHWTQDIAVMNISAFCVAAIAIFGSMSVVPACANDTAAELSIGGLQFSRTSA